MHHTYTHNPASDRTHPSILLQSSKLRYHDSAHTVLSTPIDPSISPAPSVPHSQSSPPVPVTHASTSVHFLTPPTLRLPFQASISFKKYEGLGNDFIMIDNRHQEEPVVTSAQAAKLCDRNFGIGGDGVIFALPPKDGFDYTMRIYNSDGSEPEMCGNGIRCLARFVADTDGVTVGEQKVHTLAGRMVPSLRENGSVCVDMGPPILQGPNVPTTISPNRDVNGANAVVASPLEVAGHTWTVTAVSMGNPHCVIYTRDELPIADVYGLDLSVLGPLFERHETFPAKTNTEFCEVISREHVKMRVWERGAAATLACGTGACATVVAGVLEGVVDRTCRVDLPGGPLFIEWREENNHVYMTGPAKFVFGGTVEV